MIENKFQAGVKFRCQIGWLLSLRSLGTIFMNEKIVSFFFYIILLQNFVLSADLFEAGFDKCIRLKNMTLKLDDSIDSCYVLSKEYELDNIIKQNYDICTQLNDSITQPHEVMKL